MKTVKYIPMLALLSLSPFMISSCSDDSTDEGTADTEQSSAKPYPLDTCIVSDEELGSMGAVYAFVYEDQVVKMCCKKCLPKFNSNPEKYLKKLEQDKSTESNRDQIDHSSHQH